MKIFFFTHNIREDNGAGILSRRIIEGLRDTLFCKVIAFTSVSAGAPYEHTPAAHNFFAMIRRFRHVRAAVRESDAVHTFDVFPYGVLVAFAALGMDKKLVITAMGSGSILPLYRPYQAFLARWAYRRADRIIAISSFTRDEILEKIPDLKITVINPGVDSEEFTTEKAKPLPREIMGLRPYILSVGALRWRKGYKYSIPAFEKISTEFPQMRYVIIGKKYSEKYVGRLEAIVRELGLEGRVVIVPDASREAVRHWYRGAELFLLLSQNIHHDVEGFGMVFLEAAASGLPVIGSKDCGIREAMREGVNGLLVDGRNSDECAAALRQILRDEKRKKTMGDASRAFAREMTWDRQIARYAALYREIISPA